MKKKLLVFAGLVASLSVLWVGVVNAANVRSGSSPRVGKDEVVNGTLYAAGQDLKIEGTVQGDVFCAGQTIDISGTVEGDVICAGQTLTVSGHVTGDVRLAGQTATVSGKVDGSATLASQVADITSAATVARDVTVTSQDSTVEGAIGRDLEAIVTRNFTLNSAVARDLDVTSPSVTLNDKTNLGGMFMYVSEADANVASGVKIAGKTEHKIPPRSESHDSVGVVTLLKLAAFSFAGFLVIGGALLLVVPRGLHAASRGMQAAPLATVGFGLAGLVGLPLLGAISFVTVVGIPLAIVIFFTWVVSLILGMPIAGHWLGSLIARAVKWQGGAQDVFALVAGLLVIFLLTLIPYVGGYVMFVALVWGEGALWYSVFKHRTLSPAGTKK